MPHQISSEMRACIQHCADCHNVCVETVGHCLQLGGAHAEASHIRLLLDCAQFSATSADFMLRGSDFHRQLCGLCAQVCDRCAEDCERFGDDEQMRRCAELCRRCAESCRRMAA